VNAEQEQLTIDTPDRGNSLAVWSRLGTVLVCERPSHDCRVFVLG